MKKTETRGRKKLGGKRIAVRLSDSTAERYEKLARDRELELSTYLRGALHKYHEEHPKGTP